MPKKAKVEIGERRERDKVVERVVLIFPADELNSTLISNQEFGRWIKARSSPFIYFNTSCNSRIKAVNEITAAGKNLIDICSMSSILPFRLSDNDATHQMLSGFLDGKNYKAIRDQIKNDPEYKSGQSQQFIFPDESRYQESVTKLVQIPLNIEVELTGQGSGKRVIFDERIRH